MNGYRRPQSFEFEANEFEYEGEREGESFEAGNEMEFRRRRRRRDDEMELEAEFEGEQGESDSEDEVGPATAFLELSSEQELDRFLPFLAPLLSSVAPMIAQIAGPLLGSIGRRVLGATNAPQSEQEQEQFLGKLLGGLFGQREYEQQPEAEYWRHRRPHHWRRPWGYGWAAPPPAPVVDEPAFEMEGEEEGFLGRIFKGLIGEVEGFDPERRRFASAKWFVRLARRASRYAARAARAHVASGQPLSHAVAQRLVTNALLRASSAGAQGSGAQGGRRSCGCSGPSGNTGGAGGAWSGGAGGGGASGTWVRQGNKIIVHL